jgi:hypothetical protein
VIWGPWLSDGLPEIGDYVQVEVEHEVTQTRLLEEGTIGGRFADIIWFTHELPKITCEWYAIRWRMPIEPASAVKQFAESKEKESTT